MEGRENGATGMGHGASMERGAGDHGSTRTTEIYTNVSRRNLIQVRSPIEDPDIRQGRLVMRGTRCEVQ